MPFTKSFPKRSDKSVYAQWEDVELSKEEESDVEAQARIENKRIMAECLQDAKELLEKNDFKAYETSIAQLASTLFDKRASHVVYWKEEKAREKFNK